MSYLGHSFGGYPSQRCSRCILQPQPTRHPLQEIQQAYSKPLRQVCKRNWLNEWNIFKILTYWISIRYFYPFFVNSFLRLPLSTHIPSQRNICIDYLWEIIFQKETKMVASWNTYPHIINSMFCIQKIFRGQIRLMMLQVVQINSRYEILKKEMAIHLIFKMRMRIYHSSYTHIYS